MRSATQTARKNRSKSKTREISRDLPPKPGKGKEGSIDYALLCKEMGRYDDGLDVLNPIIHVGELKPENWKVEFNPEKLELVAPGDLQQVEMTITPYEDALVGDYSISVNVEGEKASKIMELRTTVKASAAWGWVGIGIIVVVIAGLLGIFRWLGRR